MAQNALKRDDDARAALAKAVEIDRTQVPKLDDGDAGPYSNYWIHRPDLLRQAWGSWLNEYLCNLPAHFL